MKWYKGRARNYSWRESMTRAVLELIFLIIFAILIAWAFVNSI